MSNGSLFGRLIPPLVAVIALLTAVVTLAGTWVMNRALADRAKRRATSLATVERDSILRLMRAGDHSDLGSVLTEAGRNPDVQVVRILQPDGHVHSSSRPEEVGLVLEDHLRQVHESGDLISRPGGSLWNGRRLVHVVRPFRAGPECRTCHSDVEPIMAWLDMEVDVTAHNLGFATFTTLSAALGGMYLLAAIAILVPGLSKVVLRPLGRLTDAMTRVRDGDLTVSLPQAGTREIDGVVAGFNRMVDDLRGARAVEEEASRLHLERVEQLAVVGELAAGLAHEVRNPLSGVKAVLDVLTKECDDAPRRRVLRDSASELMRIDQILRELLQFARPKPPALMPFEFNALVRDAVTLTFPAGAGQAAPTPVGCNLADGLPSAIGDAGQVRQVLVNLLLNAQQAVGKTGAILVSTGSEDGYLWCRVKDDGPGVAPERAEAIFRPFVTSRTRGTGLGLSISRRVVELHGGRLVLDNPGEPGASFTFTLPAAASGTR